MEFYSDFHNCQLDQQKTTKVLEDELFGLEKTYAAENELCQKLERELNAIERDLSYEMVRSLKASSFKYETAEKISRLEDSIRDEKSSLAKNQEVTAERKYRVQKECQNVEERAHATMNFFAKKDSSRKLFELEETLSTEEDYFANLAANSQNAIKEIGNLKIKDSDVSAEKNAIIVDVASTVLKLKRMKSQKKSCFKAPINNQSNQLRNFSASSILPRQDNRTESFLDHLKTRYQSNQLQSKDSSFSQSLFGRKPLLPTKQLPLRSPLLQQGQQSMFQRKEFQTPVTLRQVQLPTLPPKQLQRPKTQQPVLPPEKVQPPVKKMSIVPPGQLQKPVNKALTKVQQQEHAMLPPKQLLTPLKMQNTVHSPKPLLHTPQQLQQIMPPPKPKPFPISKPSSIARKSEEINIIQNPKDAISEVTIGKPFEFSLDSSPQSSIDSSPNSDIFSSKPGDNSGGFGGGFSFLTSGLSGTDELDNLFGGSNTSFLF